MECSNLLCNYIFFHVQIFGVDIAVGVDSLATRMQHRKFYIDSDEDGILLFFILFYFFPNCLNVIAIRSHRFVTSR